MSGGKRSPRSALSTPTPSANPASAHSHSPTATASTRTQHLQQQLSPHSIANNSNMGDAQNIPMPPIPPADHPSGGNGSATKIGAPSFAAVVSASPPTARSTSSIYSAQPQPAQEHAQSSSGLNSHKNNINISNSDLSGEISVSTDPPQTIIVTGDAHRRSPSGGSLTSSSRYHSPLASPAGSAGNSGHSIRVGDVAHATISNPGLATATVASTPSLGQEARGVATGTASDVELDTDSAGHDSGESSDDVEIYLDTLALHDSAARMHVLNGSHATGDGRPTSRSSPNSKPLFEPAHHSQGQVFVSAAGNLPNSSRVGAQTLQDQQRQLVSIRPPTSPNTSSSPSSDRISTSNASHPSSNLNSGALRGTGPHSVSPSSREQQFAATGVDESGGVTGLSAGGAGPTAKNALSPLPVPLSVPLSTSPSNSSTAASLHLQAQQPSEQSFEHQQRQIPTANQGRNPPRAPVYSTIPLPEVDNHAQASQSFGYDHAPADSTRQQQLDLDRQHQQHLQLQQQQQDQHQQRMYGQAGVGSMHGPGQAEIHVSGLTGLSISGDGRAQQQQQFLLGITSSQTLPSISTSGPFDFDSSPNTYSGPTIDSNASGFPTSASDSALVGAPGSGAGTTSTADLGLGPKTPNVYINGLPPHFPEDQLFALASPFGEVRSVRTFTRHVRDSESGYGFVLFETIEAAERCILTLRKYRNLHPTFSKQIHKIPGTIYAQGSTGPSSWDEHGSGDSGGSSPCSVTSGQLSAEASFKARMESLQDPTSTNLYMEGLPLSIDEPTLGALVSPHRIISSRFFQTRLSNPPRIIAFVRLETRVGAEEVIERLHGRMVRGWNDAGSRISVRFADTSEQRELRRQERAAQEGDASPGRLTIAQAALLNLRGQQLKAPSPASGVSSQGQARTGGFSTSVSAPDFSSNGHLNLPPVIGTSGGGLRNPGVDGVSGNSGFEVDYSLAPGRNVSASRSRSPYPYQLQSQGHYSLGHTPPPPLPTSLPPSTSGTDPAMHALLDSLRSNGVPFRPGPGGGGYAEPSPTEYDYSATSGLRGVAGHGYHHPQHYHEDQQLLPPANHLASSQSLDSFHHPYGHPHTRPAPAYTRSGYTATEEYIMRSHAEGAAMPHAQTQQHHHLANAAVDRRRPAPLDLRRRRSGEDPEGLNYQDPSGGDAGPANIAVGVRAYRAQASVGRVGPMGSGQSLMSSHSTGSASMGMLGSSASMPSMSSLAGMGHSGAPMSAGASPLMGVYEEEEYHSSVENDASQRRGPNVYSATMNARLAREHHVQRPPMPLSPSIGAPQTNQEQSSLSNAADDTINYQHAAAHMRSTTLPQHRPRERGHYQQNSMSMPAQNLRTPQHASVAAMSGPRGIDEAPASGETNHEYEGQGQQGGRQVETRERNNSNVSTNNVAAGSTRSPMFGDLVDSASAGHSPSPSLISPTLTYSGQTPSTLSPATPFFGSFHSQSEGFGEKNGGNMDQGHHLHQPKKHGSGGNTMNPSSLRSLTSESG